MPIHRRDVLTGLGALAGMAAFRTTEAPIAARASGFPRKADFQFEDGYTYLNAAYTHPIPKVSMEAVRRAAEGRSSLHPPSLPAGASGTPKALFAELINAKPSEIAYVSSTSFEPGRVLGQEPDAGQRAVAGSTVVITLARAPRWVEVWHFVIDTLR